MNFSRVAIRRPIGTLILYGVVILIGITAFLGLPIELLPDLSFPRLTVSTEYSGAGPEEVENLVSRIIEEAASTVDGARQVTSNSSEGSSRVTVTLAFGTNLDVAANDLRTAIERVRRRLPDGASTPTIFKFDPSQSPIMQLGLVATAPSAQIAELRQLAEDQLVFRLERIPGVALVDIRGGVRRQILVELDGARLRALSLSEREVMSALAAANLAAPIGEVIEGRRELGLRALSEYRNLAQIQRTVVTVRGSAPVYVKDVARVTEGTEEERGLVRVNGRPGILLQIQRQPGVNTVAVSDRVLAEVVAINRSVDGASLVVIGDNAHFIRRSIRSVQEAAVIGGGLAVAVLAFFLRDLRSIMIISTTIPISVIGAFALMYFSGYTLNLMTLGALALGIGMLLDASIVVLENVFRHRELGAVGREAAGRGAGEVAGAVIASTLTSVVVFLPVVFMRGGAITTQLFFQFSVVVIFSQFCSLAVALSLTPVFASWLPVMKQRMTDRGWTLSLITFYRGLLERALNRRRLVFVISAIIFVAGFSSYRLVGREVIPQADEGEIFVGVDLPAGSLLEETSAALTRLEGIAREAAPEIKDVTLTAGTAGFGGQSHRGNLRIRLKDKSDRRRSTDAVAAELRQRLQVPGGRVSVRPSAGALAILRFASSTDPIAIDIRGFDLAAGMELAQQIRTTLEQIPGVTDASVSREELVPELSLRIDIERAAAFGLTPAQISSALRTSVGGGVATIFREAGRERNIVVRLREGDRRRPADILALPIATPSGQQITLGQVAELQRSLAPGQIFRRGRQRVITVSAGLSGRDFGTAMDEVRAKVARIPLPEGFALAYGEEYEEQQRANRQLIGGFLLAVVLVFAVMAIQFEALLEPLLIMGAVPFALSGSFLVLFLTNTTLNIQSLIGLLVLAGIVVNNAIVLLDFILVRHRQEGQPLYQATVDAAAARLRPVLMTTLTTVLGLFPIALGFGEGAELQAPLARSVLGGMLLSTLVTLVFIPALYVSVEEFKIGRRERRAVRAPLIQPAPVAGGSNGEAPGREE